MSSVWLLSLLFGCPPSEGAGKEDDSASGPSGDDRDGDFYADAEDCDPDDPATHPGADEVCDGKDNDCDGSPDDGFPATVWHPDRDTDGFGAPGEQLLSCLDQPGWVTDATDCDDTNPTVFPGAPEICNDGVVQDCAATEVDARAACALAGDLTLGSTGLSLNGDAAGDLAGAALAAGGFGGAGSALAVGAPGRASSGQGSGAVWVMDGATEGTVALATAAAAVTGLGTNDQLGAALAALGDLDGDGDEELLVGSPGDETEGNASGAAWLLPGPVGAGPVDTLGWHLTAPAAGDRGGAALAGVGDMDGDGFPEWAIGAWGSDAGGIEAGAVYLFRRGLSAAAGLDTADRVLTGAAAYQHAGQAVAGAGDLDGDGLAELVVGAPTDVSGGSGAGAAWVVSAFPAASGSLAVLGIGWLGAPGDAAGTAVAGLGDVDGDGYGDLAVGAPGSTVGVGAVYVVAGPATAGGSLTGARTTLLGENAGDAAGSAVAGAGDVDGDGRGDLLAGGPGVDTGGVDAGAAWLVVDLPSGVGYLARAAAVLGGPTAGGRAGSAVQGGTDVDGDGFPELFVGAPGVAYGDVTGAAWLLAGAGP